VQGVNDMLSHFRVIFDQQYLQAVDLLFRRFIPQFLREGAMKARRPFSCGAGLGCV
jgi:hypothetical protein